MQPASDRGVWHVMRELIEAGKVTAVIARTFRLSEVPQAFGIWLRNTEAAARSGLPCKALCPLTWSLSGPNSSPGQARNMVPEMPLSLGNIVTRPHC